MIVTISDVAFGGKGVARHNGKVFFVPFTAPGDIVKIRITRDKKKFAEAEVEAVVTPSPDRVEPRCEWFGICGGCALQHIAYDAQLTLKHKQVEQTLIRVGKFTEVPMRPIVPAPEPYEYRNRIRVHVADGETGFFAHGSHQIVPITHCAIAKPGVNDSLRKLRRAAVQDGDYSLTEAGRGRFFEQTNDAVAEAMLREVEALIPPAQALLVDAYCGAGFFARRLVPRFEKIIGIEENEHAVAQARRDASPKERYFAGDVAIHLGDALAGADAAATTVLLDPPATGIVPRVADILIAARPARIIYVSCNPATLARDLALFTGTYRLVSVTPLDMFPQTAEVETIAELALLP